ncbi:hypothetical protein [Butyrivibrio sp. AE2005]|uniref:hypothetical protein n=1 Tax=Butyrivibrio sp. AE2005 TaxID=1496722 RepID=UPI00047BF9C7|nr:hypothetical protein [Butyrivibrio sp. AE2005]
MNKHMQRNRKLPIILSGILIICFSTLGGYSGAKLYTSNNTTKEQRATAVIQKKHIQGSTEKIIEAYSNSNTDFDNKATTKVLIKPEDASEVAERTANLVSTKLINNSISGLATKEEVQALENKVSEMFSSYELSDSQKEDLSNAVAALIELDLNNLSKDSNAQTALTDAAYKNIKDLQTKVASLQSQIDDINTKLSAITSDTTQIQSVIDSSLDSYTTSDKTSALQSKIDKLTKQYEDILSKYNKQTAKIQALIKDNSDTSVSEALKDQITTLQSTLSKLQESATSEITVLEERIDELKTSSPDKIINELKSKISEQQDQISTYKDNIKDLKRAMTDLKSQLNTLSDDDDDAREKIKQQIKDNTDLINQNQSNIDSANIDISDMEKEINRLKTGTTDSIDTLQDQITTITSSLTEMNSTQQTLDDLLKNLKSTIGNPDESAPGTILSDLSSTQNALSMLEGRVDELEKKTQNIKPGVKVPFSFGVKDGEYGYYNADNTFVDFKSQSDIEGAVSDATGNMTGTAEKDKYIVTAQGTPEYKTDKIKNNFVVSLVGSKDPEGNYILKANGQNIHKLPKQTFATGNNYTGTSGSLVSSKLNSAAQLPMSNYNDKEQYSFKLGSAEQVTFPAGYYDMPINVANGLLPKGTYKATARAANIDMGEASYYRHVDTTSVPNSNSGTYTFPYGNGETVDLGETNAYRYVNAWNVYSKGSSDGYNSGYNAGSSAGYNSGYNQGRRSMVTSSDTWMAVFGNSQAAYSPLIAIGETFTYCHISCSVANGSSLNDRDTLLLYGPNWTFLSETPINRGIPDGDGHWRHCAPQGIAFIIIKNNNGGSRDYNFHFTN